MERSYEEFKNSCLKGISELQEEFTNLYNLNDYPEWYYDHDLGIFTFKFESKNLYFKYVDVGSFSRKAKTWFWAWANSDTPQHVTRGLEKVKQLGEEKNFSELTTDLLEGDEYTGWALTAITAKLLNGIGIYRAVSDELEMYFVFKNEIGQEQFNDIKGNKVLCDCHGPGKPAFICQHIIAKTGEGFNEAFPSDPEDLDEEEEYMAWCDDCEKEWLKKEEWNKESMAFADFRVVCNECYFDWKERILGYRKGE